MVQLEVEICNQGSRKELQFLPDTGAEIDAIPTTTYAAPPHAQATTPEGDHTHDRHRHANLNERQVRRQPHLDNQQRNEEDNFD